MIIKIAKNTDISHEEWLNYRRRGIGGSDAATIVGLQRFGSQLELWADKRGLLPPKEDSEVMRQGHDLEDYVARRWMEATGKRVRRNNYVCGNPNYPYSIANVDREIVGENAGLECKTTSLYNKSDFEGGEIPSAYYVQCQHYMAVMGYDRMYLAVLVLSGGLYHFVIERSQSEIDALMEQERLWWESYMLKDVEPPTDGSESSEDALRLIHPKGEDETRLLMDKEQELSRLEELSAEIDRLQLERDIIKQSIMQALGDASYGESHRWKISWKFQESRRVDSKALKSKYPAVYDECSKVSSSRVLRIKAK